MNSDTKLTSSDIFVKLKKFMDTNPEVGAVGIKILNPDSTLQPHNKRTPTVLDLFIRVFGFCLPKALVEKRTQYYEMLDVGYDHLIDVEFLAGSFLFCRQDVLKSVNGFDENYFLYLEDADLCKKIQQTNHRTVYYPDVSIIHFWERKNRKSFWHMLYFGQSSIRFFWKWGLKVV